MVAFLVGLTHASDDMVLCFLMCQVLNDSVIRTFFCGTAKVRYSKVMECVRFVAY